ncbi:MAG: exodeoxyribonuclease VII large subunit, partial [Myxococcales bacterium]
MAQFGGRKPPAPPAPGQVRAGQFDLFGRPSAGAAAAPRVLTVTELTRDMKGALESRFARVMVRGEISNYKPAASGHLYFTLKDDGACIASVLFRADAARIRFPLKDGLCVVARGRVSLYEPRGQYQLICDGLEPEGAGALALAFEALKARLSKEGLFDPARKRRIPFLPRRIGVVTSPSGAAIRDFLRVLHDRFPIPVLIAPARVQGEGAAQEIASGIARLAASGLVDVIVVTRGGGSIEDLWSFNEEVVARAIAASPVPVVSAVGHEVDFTISDFVADRRCATPTDAAKTLAPSLLDLRDGMFKYRRHLLELARRNVLRAREKLHHRKLRLADPRRQITNRRLALGYGADKLHAALTRRMTQRRQALQSLRERLAQAHPRARLGRAQQELSSLRERLQQA